MRTHNFYDVIQCAGPELAIGLGSALVGAVGSLLAPKPKAPPAPNIPAPPPPAQQPQGSPTSAVPQQAPSFLAAAAAPTQANTTGGPGKTLLGA